MPPRYQTLNRGDALATNRVHVTDPQKWGSQVGTDFWMQASVNGQALASGTANALADGGWTVVTTTPTGATAVANFNSKAVPGTAPGNYAMAAAASRLQSPNVFGDYNHAHAAAIIAGQKALPRLLIADIYATFSVASADEPATQIGFIKAAGSSLLAADAAATFTSKGTGLTFNMTSNAVATTGVKVVDNLPHWFRLVMNLQTQFTYGYIDGVLQGAPAILAAVYPVSFGLGASTTNRIQLTQAHIFYDWSLAKDPQGF